jgi:hypothetical protein
MATKKTMAKATAKAKARKGSNKAAAKAPAGYQSARPGPHGLPEGYQAIDTGFAERWDLEAEPFIEGTWGAPRAIEVKRGRKTEETIVTDVTLNDGRKLSVWQSAMLAAAFATFAEGDQVWILFQGYGDAKKGQNPPKLFQYGYVPGHEPKRGRKAF